MCRSIDRAPAPPLASEQRACGYQDGIVGNVSTRRDRLLAERAVRYARRQRAGRASPTTDLALGGIMNYVELDVNNLRRWILGQIGATGTLSRATRTATSSTSPIAATTRAMWPPTARRRSRFRARRASTAGRTSSIPPSPTGLPPNDALDVGEDVNANGAPGRLRQPARNGAARQRRSPFDARRAGHVSHDPVRRRSEPGARSPAPTGPSIFRRALKLVNGAQGNIITPGMTVASENPVYVQGNFNATAGSVMRPARTSATAIIADSVTAALEHLERHQLVQRSRTTRRIATRRRPAIGWRSSPGKGLAFPKPA